MRRSKLTMGWGGVGRCFANSTTEKGRAEEIRESLGPGSWELHRSELPADTLAQARRPRMRGRSRGWVRFGKVCRGFLTLCVQGDDRGGGQEQRRRGVRGGVHPHHEEDVALLIGDAGAWS